MEVTAKLQHLRMAPRKVRLVASMLKGLPAAEALTELRHLPKRASLPIEKLLRSALANAKHNFHLDEKNLRVKLAIVDSGPVMKRFRARAFGRAATIRKRMSHVTIVLDEFIPSSQKARKVKKAAAPIVREASLEDMKEAASQAKLEAERPAERKIIPKTKSAGPGFVRRIFNRKAV